MRLMVSINVSTSFLQKKAVLNCFHAACCSVVGFSLF